MLIEYVMAPQTVTRATECDLEPGDVFSVLAEASNLPKWAPVFADAVERVVGARYRVTKNGASFSVELTAHSSAGTVDFIREMPNGNRGGAYLRVTPRPLGGCTITMTVPIAPTTNESEVAKVLERELIDLVQLARR
jgi:Polyketide cyclase / dehydrase and lipid transport